MLHYQFIENGNRDTPYIPGGSPVRYLRGRSTEFFCRECKSFIKPVYVHVQDATYPACLKCFYDDLTNPDQEFLWEGGYVEETETSVAIIEPAAANSDNVQAS